MLVIHAILVLSLLLLNVVNGFDCTFLYIEQQGAENFPYIPYDIYNGDRDALPACPQGDYNADTWPSTSGCRLSCPDTVIARTGCITYGFVNAQQQGVLHMTCEADSPVPPNNAAVMNCTDNSSWGTTTQSWTLSKCGECFFSENCLPESFAGYVGPPGGSGGGGSGGGGASSQPTTSPMENILVFCRLSVFFAVGVFVL